jgi:hypothetical protein
MTVCKRLFFLAVAALAALLPMASDAQQGCYYSRNVNYYTITKQQQISYYYYVQQQQAMLQQNYTPTYQQYTPTPQGRTPTQMSSTLTPQQRTATQLQYTQTMQARTATATNYTQTILSHTTPQLMTTPTAVNRTVTPVSYTPTAMQCTYTQIQHTATALSKTVTPVQKTPTAVTKTATVTNFTPTVTQFTPTVISKTPTVIAKTGTQWEKMWGQKTITTSVTMAVMSQNNCMQCHHQQPTGVMTAHAPRMPVEQQPGRFPMLAPRQQPYPAFVGKGPMMPAFTGPVAPLPQMVAKQQPLPQGVIPAMYRPNQAIVIPGQPPVPMIMTPVLKLADLPALVRSPDAQPPRLKLDPLAAAATPNRPAPTIDRVPVAAEPMLGLGLRPSGRGMDVFDHLTMGPQAPPAADVQVFVLPLSEEDLQQPPTRQLAAAVIQLPPAPELPAILKGQGDEELLLPVIPSGEPLSKRDPLELFGATPQPAAAPSGTNPQPLPTLTQPDLPRSRDAELTPG